jgi:HSP20 family protein
MHRITNTKEVKIMALTKWSPATDLIHDLDSMQKRMNRMFNDFFSGREEDRDELITGSWNPAVDVAEHDDSFVIEAELPGMNKDDIKISVANNILTIHGEKKVEKEDKKKNYHRTERAYGSFTRTFNLPDNIKVDKVDAEFKNGVLLVTVPKSEEAKPKQIDVRIK